PSFSIDELAHLRWLGEAAGCESQVANSHAAQALFLLPRKQSIRLCSVVQIDSRDDRQLLAAYQKIDRQVGKRRGRGPVHEIGYSRVSEHVMVGKPRSQDEECELCGSGQKSTAYFDVSSGHCARAGNRGRLFSG